MPNTVIPNDLRPDSMFLVWGPPSHGPRSRVFASELGIRSEFIFSTRRRGLLVAPWKYAYQAIATGRLLRRIRPRLIFVQSPPSLAVLAAWIYARRTGAQYIVDAHSAAFLSPYWARPHWMQRALARSALTTIVTNEQFAEQLRTWDSTATILRDVPTTFAAGDGLPRDERFSVLVVSTFAADEPLRDILSAARRVPDVHFYVTGDPERADSALVSSAPDNVEFTGYLPDDLYYGTMRTSDVVLCLTTRDNTMQRGACEALSMARPIITSDWPLLRDYFSKGTVYVGSEPEAIAVGIQQMKAEHDRHKHDISELQRDQRLEWATASGELGRLIHESVGMGARMGDRTRPDSSEIGDLA